MRYAAPPLTRRLCRMPTFADAAALDFESASLAELRQLNRPDPMLFTARTCAQLRDASEALKR